jgi:superfamily II DNA/RNA helicase
MPKNKRRAYTALRFLLKEGEVAGTHPGTAHLKISKTIVFFDTKNEVYEALEKCCEWLEKSDKHQYTPQQIQQTIRIFHRNTAQHDKETIIREFRRLTTESSIRVIFATEALGVGVNIPDIRRVVQYGIPKGYHPAVLWQRGGRGSRDGQDGEVILLADEWAFGPRDEVAARKYSRQLKSRKTPHGRSTEDTIECSSGAPTENCSEEEVLQQEQASNTLSDKDRRERLPVFWHNLINTCLCIRKQFLDFFKEPEGSDNSARQERCCSYCNPEFALEDPVKYYLYSEKGPSYNNKRKLIEEDLEKWAWSKCREIMSKDKVIPTDGYVLTKSQRIELARYAHQVLKKEDILSRLKSWRWYDQFGNNLFEELRKAYYKHEKSSQTPARMGRVSQRLGPYTSLIILLGV